MLNVLHVAAECAPLAKAGGLGDVIGALPRVMPHLDDPASASVLLPAYDWLRDHLGSVACAGEVRAGAERLAFTVHAVTDGRVDFPAFAVTHPCFAGDAIYGGGDELGRGAVLSAAALALCRARAGYAAMRLDVLHVHDHHPAFAATGLGGPPPAAVVTTVHNARYHGALDWAEADRLDLPRALDRGSCDHGGRFNRLKAAVLAARRANTVSPTHARELIAKPEASGGLDYAFRLLGDRFTGILNGIDVEVWNPATDPHLDAHWSRESTAGKAAHRSALCAELGLDAARPLLAFVARLVPEKGVDALRRGLSLLAERAPGVQAAILGAGDPALRDGLLALEAARPASVRVVTRHDERMAHRLIAGADALLMPSWHEPCGLTQMYAMRYGTVPVVFPAGGLRDSVTPFDATTGLGTGAWMATADGPGLADAVARVLDWHRDPATWSKVVDNAMAADHSWSVSARLHVAEYRRAMETPA